MQAQQHFSVAADSRGSLGIAGAHFRARGPAAVSRQAQHFLHRKQLLRGRRSTLCPATFWAEEHADAALKDSAPDLGGFECFVS